MDDPALKNAFDMLREQLLKDVPENTIMTMNVVQHYMEQCFEYGFELGKRIANPSS